MSQPFAVERVEYKYLLPMEKAAQLRHQLARALHPDPHNGSAGYRVKSLYFDTWSLGDYREKDAGILHRKKLRLRLYDEADAQVQLERKEKLGDRQVKYTALLSPAEAKVLAAGDRRVLLGKDETVAGLFYPEMVLRRPVVMIEYKRQAYCWPHHNVRITLDSHIMHSHSHFGLFQRQLPYHPMVPGGQVVLETKYNRSLEPFIRDILAPYCTARLSYGKYERCIGSV